MFLSQVDDVKAVYDVVNEEQYSEIVRRRQEEDWVVDDGKMRLN